MSLGKWSTFRFQGNWPPTPPLNQDFALGEKQLGEGYVGSFTEN